MVIYKHHLLASWSCVPRRHGVRHGVHPLLLVPISLTVFLNSPLPHIRHADSSIFQADLDLGNYERFLDVTLTRDHNITTGKVYAQVINAERRGDYLGKTVQVCVPLRLHPLDAGAGSWLLQPAGLYCEANPRLLEPPLPSVAIVRLRRSSLT